MNAQIMSKMFLFKLLLNLRCTAVLQLSLQPLFSVFSVFQVYLFKDSSQDSPVHSVSLGPTSFFYLPSVPINNQVSVCTVLRPRHSTRQVWPVATDAVAQSMCLSVGHKTMSPAKNGLTDLDADWHVDLGGPKEPCIRCFFCVYKQNYQSYDS